MFVITGSSLNDKSVYELNPFNPNIIKITSFFIVNVASLNWLSCTLSVVKYSLFRVEICIKLIDTFGVNGSAYLILPSLLTDVVK